MPHWELRLDNVRIETHAVHILQGPRPKQAPDATAAHQQPPNATATQLMSSLQSP